MWVNRCTWDVYVLIHLLELHIAKVEDVICFEKYFKGDIPKHLIKLDVAFAVYLASLQALELCRWEQQRTLLTSQLVWTPAVTQGVSSKCDKYEKQDSQSVWKELENKSRCRVWQLRRHYGEHEMLVSTFRKQVFTPLVSEDGWFRKFARCRKQLFPPRSWGQVTTMGSMTCSYRWLNHLAGLLP